MDILDSQCGSANQLWRVSGSGLSFKDWLNREKAKGEVIPQKCLNDALTDEVKQSLLGNKVEVAQPIKKQSLFLGLNTNVLILSGLVIVGAIAYNIYRKKR